MTQSRVETAMRAGAMLIALVVTSYLAVVQGNEPAAGAIIAVLASSAGYIYRGKVEKTS